MCDFDSDFSIEVHLGASCLNFMEYSLTVQNLELVARILCMPTLTTALRI